MRKFPAARDSFFTTVLRETETHAYATAVSDGGVEATRFFGGLLLSLAFSFLVWLALASAVVAVYRVLS